MDEPQSVPAGVTAGTTHDLTLNERLVLTHYFGTLAIAKGKVHDLLADLDKARAAVAAAQSSFDAVTTTITGAHDMTTGTFSDDFSKITAK